MTLDEYLEHANYPGVRHIPAYSTQEEDIMNAAQFPDAMLRELGESPEAIRGATMLIVQQWRDVHSTVVNTLEVSRLMGLPKDEINIWRDVLVAQVPRMIYVIEALRKHPIVQAAFNPIDLTEQEP